VLREEMSLFSSTTAYSARTLIVLSAVLWIVSLVLIPTGSQKNTVPLQRSTVAFTSTVHCVGENFGSDAWKYRSCQFRNLCYDTSTKEYLVVQSLQEQRLAKLSMANVAVSSLLVPERSSVSQSVIHQSSEETLHIPWFPRVVQELPHRDYYQLDDSIVMVATSGLSSGPLFQPALYFLPIYTLLSMFGLEDKQILILPSLDSPLVLGSLAKDGLVCSKYGAAGIGSTFALTSNSKMLTHRVGQSTWSFRNYLIDKLGIPSNLQVHQQPDQMVTIVGQSNDFADQLGQSNLGVTVQSLQTDELDLTMRARTVSTTSILVTHCGDAASEWALFLPRGALWVVLCDTEKEDSYRDLLAKSGYIRLALLPIQFDELLLITIIQRHLDMIRIRNHSEPKAI
jgi:hypothetical protein